MTIVLRPATRADAPLLQRWDEMPDVIASDPNDDWNWNVELGVQWAWREQLLAELDGRPIGFVQIIDPAREESHYWGDCAPDLAAIDIWIGEPDCLGQGHGTRIMRLAIARCFADPRVAAVLVDPLAENVRARRFYAKLGFEEIGPRRFGLDDCMVMRLDRKNWRD